MHKSLIFGTVGFLAGLTAGIIYSRLKYERLMEEKCNEIYDSLNPKEEISEPAPIEPIKYIAPETIESQLTESIYNPETIVQESKKINKMIFVIQPDEFAVDPRYQTETIIYYADKVLAYEVNDDVVDDIDDTIGTECLEQFNSDDTVYVRNDWCYTYYEVIRVDKTYTEVTGKTLNV